MKKSIVIPVVLLATLVISFVHGQNERATNPIIYADVPDMSMIRVGDTYYMSSTTMHMAPGVPIMKSKDLVNWDIVNYAYEILEDNDHLNLIDDKRSYGRGSWASSLRYHEGIFYVSTFASTTGKTHIYTTQDIEKGPWKAIAFPPSMHDHTLVFEEDKVFLIWGAGKLTMVELEKHLSGIKPGTEKVLIENATAPAGSNVGLPAEGSQMFKVDGKYYLFNIAWPKEGMRTVIVHRSDNLLGPYEGRVMLQDKGVAQGGLIDTPDSDWYAYLFRDYGAVGRIPYLVPVTWEEGWPILGVEGKVPDRLDLPKNESLMPGIVDSDDFERKEGDESLPLVWQWNHNPVPDYWSLSERKGFLRLTTSRIDQDLLYARNTLTQRTIGPVSSGITKIDFKGMHPGDIAGLALIQRDYGFVAVKAENGKNKIIQVLAPEEKEEVMAEIPISQDSVFLKAECDFRDRTDVAYFYYSLDGIDWKPIGAELKMKYTLPHFMGYRFGLFNFSTKKSGGYVDFDFFHISDKIANVPEK
jgi:beta-xylosidase